MSAAAFGGDASEYVRLLSGADERAADDARMKLEKLGAEKELIGALDNAKNARLRDGIIYSLGKMKSAAAYARIAEIALKEGDKCPAAVLALAEYGTPQSEKDLRALASKNCAAAKTALWMQTRPQPGFNEFDEAFFANFDSLDDKRKAEIFRVAAENTAFKKFAMQYNPKSDRVAAAQSFALARLDFKNGEGAEKIARLAEAFPKYFEELALALASARNSENAIIGLIKERKRLGARAAQIRRCSEAESALLEARFESPDSKFDRFAADALQNCASDKTLEKLCGRFAEIKNSDLPDAVKILTEAMKRASDAAKSDAAAALKKSSLNADDAHRKAAARILGQS